MENRIYIFDISKKILFTCLLIILTAVVIFGYWIYKETKPAKYEFDLVYLTKPDIALLNGVDSLNCFAERINENGVKIYSCTIARKIK